VSGTKVREIKKAAVLGSGVMGMAIAAHLAGCGIDCLVLDIVPFDNMLSEKEIARRDTDKSVRNKLGNASLKTALKWKPPASAFYSKNDAQRITIGNFDDDFEKISECDWIIEVVVERMDIKKQILAKVDEHRAPGSIVATNTSGLSIAAMSEDCSDDMKEHFLGAHFFNPVRFMKLLEIIPHPQTKPEILDFMHSFCADVLGKGVIFAKDTPNFIANRIGVHSMFHTLGVMQEMGLAVNEVDAICGEAIGNARSAVFKTADLVGLDTLSHVAKTIYDNCLEDEERDKLQSPAFLTQMIENGLLGRKTKAGGFYKRGKSRKEKFVLDWKTMEYLPEEKPDFASVKAAKKIKRDPGKRLKTLINGDDKAAEFAWKVVTGGLVYAASRVPEIADTIIDIDNGMRWGFNRSIGPFESWDGIGVRESVERMQADGITVPQNVLTMLENGNESFYKEEDGVQLQYDLVNQKYIPVPVDEKVFIISEYENKTLVEKNDGATIWDIGDGVLLFEMHTKMNAIDDETIAMQNRAVDILEENDAYKALVIANDGKNFSVGANLMMVLMGVMGGAMDQVEKSVKGLQDVNMRMKYASKPVVAAPVGFCFGGGCEILQHCDRVVGAAESYIGLVEVGVGLIPAGGGTKEMVVRSVESLEGRTNVPVLPFVQKAFESVAKADVATSLKQAIDLGYLRSTDVLVPNAEYRITRAKEEALKMANGGYTAPEPLNAIPVGGESTTAAFMIAVAGLKDTGWASDHDQLIANKVARIMGGGARAEGQTISEQELLDMEREAFMELLKEEKTLERMQYMLQNNKPLRN
jgi:3-hydroxyacyl-CoA dehydrogenase